MELNLFMCVGEITHDVELNQTKRGFSVCNFNLKVKDREFRDAGEDKIREMIIRVVAWKALAERIHSKLGKGVKVIVTGKIVYREFMSGSEKRKVHEVLAHNVQVVT